jgi:hypothetical protein
MSGEEIHRVYDFVQLQTPPLAKHFPLIILDNPNLIPSRSNMFSHQENRRLEDRSAIDMCAYTT